MSICSQIKRFCSVLRQQELLDLFLVDRLASKDHQLMERTRKALMRSQTLLDAHVFTIRDAVLGSRAAGRLRPVRPYDATNKDDAQRNTQPFPPHKKAPVRLMAMNTDWTNHSSLLPQL
jgi:hypothetical protein